MVDAVYRKFQKEISSDQVKYVMKCNNIRNKDRARGSCRAGGAGDAVDFLLHKMKSGVALLLNHCASGDWFTGTARLSNANDTEIVMNKLSEWKPKLFKSRLVFRTSEGVPCIYVTNLSYLNTLMRCRKKT